MSEELEKIVLEAATGVLEALGVSASLQVRPRPVKGREPIEVLLTAPESTPLAPRRWTQLSQALTVLLEASLAARGHVDQAVLVTLPEQPARRGKEADRHADPGLESAAQALARAAAARGRAFAIGPMSVGDRRLVHQALGEVPEVWTQSAGEGIFRRLWVMPRPMMEASEAGEGGDDDAVA